VTPIDAVSEGEEVNAPGEKFTLLLTRMLIQAFYWMDDEVQNHMEGVLELDWGAVPNAVDLTQGDSQ
jgi:hypothetical protein